MLKKVDFINYIGNYFIFIRYKMKTELSFKFMLSDNIKNVFILYNVFDLFNLIFFFTRRIMLRYFLILFF